MKKKREKEKERIAHRICHFGLTGAFVEFACLCNIPFAESSSLTDGWSHSIHVVPWQDGVQEDASGIHRQRIVLMLHENAEGVHTSPSKQACTKQNTFARRVKLFTIKSSL